MRPAGKLTPPVEAVTVTEVAPASSDTLDGLAESVMSAASLSLIVIVAEVTSSPAALPSSVRDSSLSTMSSSVGVSVKVVSPCVACASISTWKPRSGVS